MRSLPGSYCHETYKWGP